MSVNAFSWIRVTGFEGGIDTDVPLLPFEQSILINLLSILKDNPDIFISDLEDIDIASFNSTIDTMILKVSK